jgi:hypothetical protein
LDVLPNYFRVIGNQRVKAGFRKIRYIISGREEIENAFWIMPVDHPVECPENLNLGKTHGSPFLPHSHPSRRLHRLNLEFVPFHRVRPRLKPDLVDVGPIPWVYLGNTFRGDLG